MSNNFKGLLVYIQIEQFHFSHFFLSLTSVVGLFVGLADGFRVGCRLGIGDGCSVDSDVGSGVSHKYPGGLVLSEHTVSAIQS